MAHGRRYDRGFGYDREFRYGRDFQRGRPRYDRSYEAGPAPRMGPGAEFAAPLPFPFVPFGFDPAMGGGWPMYGMGPAPGRYDESFHRAHPPRQSPAYGRGGDRALRAWADRYGYDVEFSIPPRPRPRR